MTDEPWMRLTIDLRGVAQDDEAFQNWRTGAMADLVETVEPEDFRYSITKYLPYGADGALDMERDFSDLFRDFMDRYTNLHSSEEPPE